MSRINNASASAETAVLARAMGVRPERLRRLVLEHQTSIELVKPTKNRKCRITSGSIPHLASVVLAEELGLEHGTLLLLEHVSYWHSEAERFRVIAERVPRLEHEVEGARQETKELHDRVEESLKAQVQMQHEVMTSSDVVLRGTLKKAAEGRGGSEPDLAGRWEGVTIFGHTLPMPVLVVLALIPVLTLGLGVYVGWSARAEGAQTEQNALTFAHNSFDKALEQQQDAINAAWTRVTEEQQKLEQKEDDLKVLSGQHEDISDALAESRGVVSTLQDSNKDNKRRIEELTKQVELLQTQLTESNSVRTTLEDALAGNRKVVESQNDLIENLRRMNAALQEQLAKVTDSVAAVAPSDDEEARTTSLADASKAK